eukprot:6040178-Pleurochrysis_carterae.AAC.4
MRGRLGARRHGQLWNVLWTFLRWHVGARLSGHNLGVRSPLLNCVQCQRNVEASARAERRRGSQLFVKEKLRAEGGQTRGRNARRASAWTQAVLVEHTVGGTDAASPIAKCVESIQNKRAQKLQLFVGEQCKRMKRHQIVKSAWR